MDLDALIAALPAETVAAVSDTPQGMDDSSKVLVSALDSARTDSARALWVLPPEYTTHGPVMGGVLSTWTFTLALVKDGGTDAQLRTWQELLRAHFNGGRKPTGVTDLVSSSVRDTMLRTSEYGADLELLMEIQFTGVERPA